MRQLITALLAVLCFVALTGCGDDEPRARSDAATAPAPSPAAVSTTTPEQRATVATSPTPEITPDDAFARLTDALTQKAAGDVLVVTLAQTSKMGGTEHEEWTTEVWLDPARDVGRAEYRKNPSFERDIPEDGTTIYAGGTTYYKWPHELVWTLPVAGCPGLQGTSFATFLVCDPTIAANSGLYPLAYAEMELSVSPDAEYQGTPAIALAYRMNGAGPDLLLDRETYLPLAWMFKGGEQVIATTFTFKTVAADSLPADFFEPASIGYQPVDAPLDDSALGVPAWWLGMQFDPGNGLPALALSSVSVPDGCCGARAEIQYASADPEQPGAGVILRVWHPTDWQTWLNLDTTEDRAKVFRLFWDSQCAKTKELEVDGGQAVIYMSYSALVAAPGECPAGEPDRFLAHVFYDDAIVTINAAFYFEQPSVYPAQYNSVEGMETLIRGLRVREPAS